MKREESSGVAREALQSILSGFFHLLYHQFAWSYDWVAWMVSLGRWRDWVLSIEPYLNGSRVLEIGLGPGHLLSAIHSKGIMAYGIDESKWMLAIAHEELLSTGRSPRLVNGLAQSLPFQAQAFSQVASTFPSEYFYQETTLREVWRVLHPGGLFVVLPVAWITGQQMRERLAAWLFRVTGETPNKNFDLVSQLFSDPLIKMGFQVKVVIKEVRNSQIMILLARKPETIPAPHP
jgi:ubiquinone/menaquinone biosynthesis C-methylase UbiE